MELIKFTLTDREKELLKDALVQVQYDSNGHCQYINQLRVIAMQTLPVRILSFLVKQKASLCPAPYFVIDNLPTDDEIISVPLESQLEEDLHNFKSGTVSENLLIAISSIIGEPYSISFEGNQIVNNLIPSKFAKKDFTGIGSEVELDFHIENAALKYLSTSNYSPQGLMLTGVNNDPDGPGTLVANGRAALNLLDEATRSILEEKRFILKVPYRWREALGGRSETEKVSIIKENCDFPDLAVAFYGDIIVPCDEIAKHALSLFYKKVKEVSIRLEIKPGTLVYVDNRFGLHSRESFAPSFDKEGRAKRWIQRTFIAPTLWGHRNLTRNKHRVFTPTIKKASA